MQSAVTLAVTIYASMALGLPVARQATVATYPAGSTPPVPGAPALPASFVYNAPDWPATDVIPPTDSAQVQEWMRELDGVTLPQWGPTVDGTCASDPQAAADAANRGWWSCGGYVRDTDIVKCQDKNAWGVSFDDGPTEATPQLLSYLKEKNIQSTFFVVGSRVMSRPDILVEEYMSGHEISIHSWSHSKALTSLTNEQIVAELGWSRKAVKDVLGVTPKTWRPPLGDIDDRVRAISMAMGLTPIMWTATTDGSAHFDTNDWKVTPGLATKEEAISTFNGILDQASSMDSGFIVLEHDQDQTTVDLATQNFLESAMQRSFVPQKISQCMKYDVGEFYQETTKGALPVWPPAGYPPASPPAHISSAPVHVPSTSVHVPPPVQTSVHVPPPVQTSVHVPPPVQTSVHVPPPAATHVTDPWAAPVSSHVADPWAAPATTHVADPWAAPATTHVADPWAAPQGNSYGAPQGSSPYGSAPQGSSYQPAPQHNAAAAPAPQENAAAAPVSVPESAQPQVAAAAADNNATNAGFVNKPTVSAFLVAISVLPFLL